MKLHSDVVATEQTIREALQRAKDAGHVGSSVYFHILDARASRSKKNGFEIQLGCSDKVKGDGRGWKNTGTRGADSGSYGMYAATYDEWGWFIAELYTLDAEMVLGHYKSLENFDSHTRFAYGD